MNISYSKSSKKFLDKNKNVITENKVDNLIIKAILKIIYQKDENINLVKMVNYNPIHYRIRFGKVRIIFMLIDDIITVVEVKNIDYRGSIYKNENR